MADINDPTGGVAQAQQEGIARKLLGDDMVNQYGDVLGVRPASVNDALRDFVVGAREGPAKLEAMRQKVRDDYDKQLIRQQQKAVAQIQTNRAQASAVAQAFKSLKGVPQKFKAQMLKEMLAPLGIEPSAASLKMLTDAETMPKLPIEDLQRIIADGGADSGELFQQMAETLGSPKGVVDFLTLNQTIKKKDQDLNNAILNHKKTELSINEGLERIKKLQEERSATEAVNAEAAGVGLTAGQLKDKQKYISTRLGKAAVYEPGLGGRKQFKRYKTPDELGAEWDSASAVSHGKTLTPPAPPTPPGPVGPPAPAGPGAGMGAAVGGALGGGGGVPSFKIERIQ